MKTRYFTWERQMFQATTRFEDLAEALKADPKDGSELQRVRGGNSTAIGAGPVNAWRLELDIHDKVVTPEQGIKELMAYAQWLEKGKV